MIWNPNPIAFNIFGLDIAWYGLTWSISILVGYFILFYIFKKENKDLSKLVPYIQYVFIGALLGARLFEMIYYQTDLFFSDPTLFFRFFPNRSYNSFISPAIFCFIQRMICRTN